MEAEESEIEALRRKIRIYEEKIMSMEDELKIAEAVKKYVKPELIESIRKISELESKIRELVEKLEEERRLRLEAEKSRDEGYRIAESSMMMAEEALEEVAELELRGYWVKERWEWRK